MRAGGATTQSSPARAGDQPAQQHQERVDGGARAVLGHCAPRLQALGLAVGGVLTAVGALGHYYLLEM
eukprot:scaffold12523_cov125-Isochrysis_galbana.AAC.1